MSIRFSVYHNCFFTYITCIYLCIHKWLFTWTQRSIIFPHCKKNYRLNLKRNSGSLERNLISCLCSLLNLRNQLLFLVYHILYKSLINQSPYECGEVSIISKRNLEWKHLAIPLLAKIQFLSQFLCKTMWSLFLFWKKERTGAHTRTHTYIHTHFIYSSSTNFVVYR